jgi:group I intron endonuclease
MFTVYLITNNINGKAYGGFTKHTVTERFKQHCEEARSVCRWYIHRAIHRYGPEAFSVSVIWQGNSEVEAKQKEKELIASMQLQNSLLGYNLTAGGDGLINPSAQVRKKISFSKKGKKFSEEHCHKIGKANTGKIRTEEMKNHMSLMMSGRTLSEAHRQKISRGLKGHKPSEKQRASVIELNRIRWAKNPEVQKCA